MWDISQQCFQLYWSVSKCVEWIDQISNNYMSQKRSKSWIASVLRVWQCTKFEISGRRTRGYSNQQTQVYNWERRPQNVFYLSWSWEPILTPYKLAISNKGTRASVNGGKDSEIHWTCLSQETNRQNVQNNVRRLVQNPKIKIAPSGIHPNHEKSS